MNQTASIQGDIMCRLRGEWSLSNQSGAKFGPDCPLRLRFTQRNDLASPWILAFEETILEVIVPDYFVLRSHVLKTNTRL